MVDAVGKLSSSRALGPAQENQTSEEEEGQGGGLGIGENGSGGGWSGRRLETQKATALGVETCDEDGWFKLIGRE